MLKCKNKFWIENISDLFCNFHIIPLEGMSLESQLNALTRLIIFVFLILLLLNFKNSLLFLLLSLLFIIILYYIQRKQMEAFKIENYTPKKHYNTHYKNKSKITLDKGKIVFDRSSNYRFCNDEVPITPNDPNYISQNQRLVGPPNPKTKIAPVVVPPSADLSYWKTNNLVTHSGINEQTQIDNYQSGYQVTTCCGNVDNKYLVPAKNQYEYQTNMTPYKNNVQFSSSCSNNNQTKENFEFPYVIQNNNQNNNEQINNQTKENFEFPYIIQNNKTSTPCVFDNLGQINTACGYNPKQLLSADLPSNFPAGNCEKDPVLKTYNKNLFTQTIQPGIYTRNEIIEPINSNIGISFTQQFEPLTCSNKGNNIFYTEHDPAIIEPVIEKPNLGVIESVNMSNIYDPRFSGYGTSYRSYNDKNLGQTKFFYDDINSVRMPNYITRSNIDFTPYADSYGPIPEGEANGNKFNSTIRALANDTFERSTIQQRTELQERLMRKINSEKWQQRMFPIHKSNQRMLGGASCN